jgi:beta-glucosidase
MQAIATPTDFLGVNYYNRTVLRSTHIPEEKNHPRTIASPEYECTDIGWEIYPEGMFHTLMRAGFEYRPLKIYVTENGASFSQGPDDSGRIRDTRRIEFLREHLIAAKRAIELGVPVAGYFVWTLLDNFEWERGYTQRFGITWVDYESQQRIAKDSALWYKRVIAENAVPLD